MTHRPTDDDFVLACHQARETLKKLYKDRYSMMIDAHIGIIREVMKKQRCGPAVAATIVLSKSDMAHRRDKTPWVFAAALEIVDEEDRKVELN